MPDDPSQVPLADRYVARLKRRPWVAALLVIAAIVTGVAGFTDSAKKLVTTFQPPPAEDPRQQLVKLDLPFTQDAFVAAAARGDDAATQLYLQAGIPVDELSPQQGTTALIAATRERREAVVKRLLAGKADQSKRPPGQSPALSVAASSGNVAMTTLLAEANPPPDIVKRAYVSAAADGQLDTLKVLAPRVAATQGAVATEALWALAAVSHAGGASPQARAGMATYLIAAGADLHAVDDDGRRSTMLHRATYQGQIDVARVLLTQGAPVDARDADGATPLWWIAGIGNVAMAQLLVEHHADVKAASKDGTTPLARARYNEDDAMVTLLRQRGAR